MTLGLLEPRDETTLMIRREYEADIETLFDALTNPDAIRQWFGPGSVTPTDVRSDLRVGGQWSIAMVDPECNDHNVAGEYLEIERPTRVVFSWAWQSTPDQVSRVTYALTPGAAGKTVLLLTHERLPDAGIRDKHGYGWGGAFDKLGPYLATKGSTT